MYVGSLADGAIWRASARTGAGEVLASGRPGRVAVGVEYDRRRDLLWVAGGETGEIRAHDADTGKVRATYRFRSRTPRFLNDLVVTPRAVYATDSTHAHLAVVPLSRRHRAHRGGALPPRSAARILRLTGAFELEDGFNLNGIIESGHRLLAVQGNTGLLFRINGRTGHTREVDLGGDTLVNGDGMEPGRGVLYVVRNQDHVIAVVDLNRRGTRGVVVETITDDDVAPEDGFAVPTTAALVKRSLYVVNARFGTPPTPSTAYWITRVPAR